MIKETDLENIPDLLIKFNEPLSNYTYTKVGGPADILAFPATIEALTELSAKAKATDTPVTVLGNASNLIVRDGGIRGLVILLEKLDSVKVAGYTIEAQAGAKLKEVTQVAQANSLTGFEFACGIPGSIGGAVFMNAGAYGGEISQVLVSCKVMDAEGNVSVLSASEMQFGYRHSVIRDKNLIVLSVKFELQAGDPTQIQNEMDRLNFLRESKQPLEYPSCGSVFKRPVGHFAGQLIQEAKLQGQRIGGVEVSKKHAGFMVNVADGNATDYEKLIALVIEKVKENSGVTLEPEVRIIGEK
ncbi:UDP-N-acetylmuramate dehydrogenase [Lactococcus cremoris]|uniref:UDP-N-acetylmuramate dehydrogenase n=1 Tax=Lactococcus lactis subsp. cremoris TaxID=1359 RepID=UPI0007AEB883|nr:UDP-N-acetylmuramate dehydrogenase [Lactococcus cremoris]KZK07064.1 UDP-N-acetylenolpyruvoylglucosamine reductase [Lactococcus cremoris]MCT0474647.1 UDP-N-acetylmuramate dehydrogenase [Lactococcus cremoris]MCT0510307.1 UDP-N-acetylmuramate dehydrogenase [Lactococcus cremoris]MDU8932388.1 UDP-N-acetylenolpyruvoylglucosamine reductase [Lactococcus cremoris]